MQNEVKIRAFHDSLSPLKIVKFPSRTIARQPETNKRLYVELNQFIWTFLQIIVTLLPYLSAAHPDTRLPNSAPNMVADDSAISTLDFWQCRPHLTSNELNSHFSYNSSLSTVRFAFLELQYSWKSSSLIRFSRFSYYRRFVEGRRQHRCTNRVVG